MQVFNHATNLRPRDFACQLGNRQQGSGQLALNPLGIIGKERSRSPVA